MSEINIIFAAILHILMKKGVEGYKMVSPYDPAGMQKAIRKYKRDKKRKEFIDQAVEDQAVEDLKHEYGTSHLNPYDLGQVGRLREIFRLSKYIK